MNGKSILIISTNWIGDAVMSMPALQRFRQEHPEAEITVLARPLVLALWQMHPAVNFFQPLEKTAQLFPMVGKLRQKNFDCAFSFPNSFRSALVPFLAGVPERIGFSGQWRGGMLTRIVPRTEGHQQFEAAAILGVQGELPAPQLDVPPESFQTLESNCVAAQCFASHGPCLFGNSKSPIITLLPGAARGPSKRWPAEHFMMLAKRLHKDLGAQVLLGGGPDDAAVCEEIAAGADSGVVSLAGQTTVSEWAALLKSSDCVVSNDSGGMHLATAVGTPVVGVFGVTDPGKTGPLGKSIVLQKSDLQNRDIKRASEEAVRALAAIRPDEVFEAAQTLLSAADPMG